MTLDFESLYNEATREALESGKRRYYDDKVKNLFKINEGKTTVTSVVKGKNDYGVKITFDETGGLYDYSCSCGDCSIARGPCRHVIATALCYEEKYPTVSQSVTIPTSPSAFNLILQSSKRKQLARMAIAEKKVELLPILSVDRQQRVVLRFMIGRSRKYVVKDLFQLINDFLGGNVRKYGVELEFAHVAESFDARSVKILNLLSSVSSACILRDTVVLSPSELDVFYSIVSGSMLKTEDGTSLLISGAEDSFLVKVNASKVDGGYSFNCDVKKHKVLFGQEYRYLFDESTVYKLSRAYADVLLPFLATFENGSTFVAEKDMTAFYNGVLVDVSHVAEINTDVDLTVYEAAPLDAKVYVDVFKGGGITARVECRYDDVEVDIFNFATSDVVRDYALEEALKAVLAEYFPQYPQFEITSEQDVYAFISKGLRRIMAFAEVFISDNVKKLRVRRIPKIRVGVKINSGLLDVNVSADEISAHELELILNAYRQKKGYVRLTDGSFVDLADQSLVALSEITEGVPLSNGKFTLPKFYAPYLDSELKNGFFELERSDEFKKLISNISGARDSLYKVPSSLKGVMRNYQKTGFRWLKTLSEFGFGGILADDMGLGKSLQVISLIKSDLDEPPKRPNIIVCPTTLILNWQNEFYKFAPNVKTMCVMGAQSERKRIADSAKDADVIITSYELIRRDGDMYSNFDFNYAIIDEAQYIKNPDTKNAKAVKTLKAQHKFALTGTPVENSLSELWSIFDFIMPGYLYSYADFRERFETEIARSNPDALGKLRKLVRPFIMRRLKSEVLKELPAKIETNVLSPLSERQAELYNANLLAIKEGLFSSQNVNKIVVLSQLMKLRQICCSPQLVYPDYNGNSAKLDACMQLATSAIESGHKVLIFSQFTSMLDIIASKLNESGIAYYVLRGDTAKAERIKLVNKFNVDNVPVFLISLKAGGTGLNLTGADVVIHYDPWWNESVMNQATDRAYRIGQDKSVQVYKLILENTVEEKILKLQEKKTKLSNLVVLGGTPSNEDLLKLFE